MAKTVIVIPTYNERDNIEPLLNKIFLLGQDIEVLFVDDNSPDATAKVISSISARDSRVRLLKRDSKEGLAGAYIAGFKTALDMGPDYIVQMDADLSHDPCYINDMLLEVQVCGMVIGSRYIKGGRVLNWSWFRFIISRTASLICGIIAGIKIKDPLGGFKCFRAELLRGLDFSKIKSKGFFFQMEMNHLITREGYSYKEIPITFLERHSGRSKFSLSIVWEAFVLVWGMRFR